MTKMQNATLKLAPGPVDWLNGMLSGKIPCEVRDGDLIVEFTVKFPDRYECDLKLVSGGRAGEPDADTPYLDPVLFDPDGREVACLQDESENVLGEYRWDLADENSYVLTVVQDD